MKKNLAQDRVLKILLAQTNKNHEKVVQIRPVREDERGKRVAITYFTETWIIGCSIKACSSTPKEQEDCYISDFTETWLIVIFHFVCF